MPQLHHWTIPAANPRSRAGLPRSG
jgi:hypothetical protein